MLRDRRVITGAFIMPVVLIFLMMQLFGFIGSSVQKQRRSMIYVVESKVPNRLVDQLKSDPEAHIKFVADEAAGKKLVESGEAKLVLSFPPTFDQDLKNGSANVKAIYDSSETTSQIVLSVFQGRVEHFNMETLKATLKAKGLPESLTEALKVDKVDMAPEKKGSELLIGLLPYMIVLWAFYGGFSIVGDMVAGEKERGTLETLLISPASRSEIALGKFFALALVCLISSMTSLLGLGLASVIKPQGSREMFESGMSLSIGTIAQMLAVLVPLVLFFAAILLAVSAWAKNMRECQTFLTLVSFVVLLPAIFSQVIGLTDMAKQTWVMFTPVLNAAVCLRQAIQGKPDTTILLATILSSLVLAGIGVAIVVRLFKREQILVRT